MASPLDELEIQSINEYLDNIYASPPDNETVKEALTSLKGMIEIQDPYPLDDEDDEETDKAAADEEGEDRVRIAAMKQHILNTKPDFFEHLLKFPEDQAEDDDLDIDTITAKSELIAEMLRDSPSSKAAVISFVDQILLSSFREDADESRVHRAWAFMARYPIAALLRSDPNAQDANEAVVKALSSKIKSFPEILSAELKASDMTEELLKKQKALTYGLLDIVDALLKPDALPSFIQTGGLDVLLTVIARGPHFPLGIEENRNEGLEQACNALYQLMQVPKSKAVADALMERQAVVPLIQQMTHICGIDEVFSASSVPRALVTLAKHHDALLKQVVAEAQNMVTSDPSQFGPGAPIVLWTLLDAAAENDLADKMTKITHSKKYVSFFLSAIKPSASDGVMEAIGEALAARIDQEPRHQLRKGISTPQDVEKFIHLLEYACNQSAPDISATARVLSELALPSSDEDTGGFIDLEEERRRVNRQFCTMFGEKLKVQWDAAVALAPKEPVDEGNEIIITEPSEEGLAHMKNIKLFTAFAEQQYVIMGLLANDLLDYLQSMIFNPSALSRRAGLELLATLTHDSSLSEDFAYVPDLIEAFKPVVLHILDNDSRPLLRALAMQWLNRIMSYRHPKSQDITRYGPGVDFVIENVSEERLVAMLKGTVDEAKVAAEMIESMARHSTGPEVRQRLKANKELMEGLWNGLFWDEEKAPQSLDQDIAEDAFIYGNIDSSSGSALSELLDPLADSSIIAQNIAPHLAVLKDKDWDDFYSEVEKMPAIASLAILKPETGILARTAEMLSHVEQAPFAMQLLRSFGQGSMLAKVHLAQSEELYPALVAALKNEEEAIQTLVLLDLDSLLCGSNVSKLRFIKEGGIKPLLEIVPSEDEGLSRKALSVFETLVDNFPEGARAAVDAGAVPVLESKRNPNYIFDRAGGALTSIEQLKDAPLIDRIEFTPEAYAEIGKNLSDPVALERLTKNFESSSDEKQLGIAGGLVPVLTDLLRSNTGSDPKPILRALKALLVIDGQGWQGFTIIKMAGQRCGMPEVLKPFVESEDEEVKELAISVKDAIVDERNDTLGNDDGGDEGNEEGDENDQELTCGTDA